ncbi:MAG: hypothetical protein KGI71_04695 [Patescibacteria group bacterium]|nr:hypothetical protein [Patescibacteria group bacterium]
MMREYDPTDPDDIEAAEADQRAYDAIRLDAWRWMLADARGRMLIADLLRDSGFLRASLTDNPLTTASLEGKRQIGQALYHLVMTHGVQYWPEIHAMVHGMPTPKNS